MKQSLRLSTDDDICIVGNRIIVEIDILKTRTSYYQPSSIDELEMIYIYICSLDRRVTIKHLQEEEDK